MADAVVSPEPTPAVGRPPPDADKEAVVAAKPTAIMGASTNFLSRLRKSRPQPGDDGAAETLEKKQEKVSFFKLYRFTTKLEVVLMVISGICAAGHGALLPLFTIIFGSVISTFTDGRLSSDALLAKVGGSSKWFLILAAIAFVLSYFQVRLSMYVAQHSGVRIRNLYFRSLMRQDFEWYDAETSGELTARVASDVDLIQGGIGDKVCSAIQFMSMFFVGFVIALAYSWRMTLVVLSFFPLLAACGAAVGRKTAGSTSDGQDSYGAAGAVASEALSLIRTVSAFSGQEEETRRYEKHLGAAYKSGIMKGLYTGLGVGSANLIIFCAYALSFWYGARLIREGRLNVTDLFVAFFSVLVGALGIGQAAPSFESFSVAQGAAPRVFAIIDRESAIDPLSEQGEILLNVKGAIRFEGIEFNYKSREVEGGAPVLKNLNLDILPGTTHALVGPSGCGKSSTMSLIERFYDPKQGRVLLDGVDIRTLNVRWLRSQMGYVGQMPTLFRDTIRENIAFGGAVEVLLAEEGGPESHRNFMRRKVTDDEVIAAAKLANAHSFIMKLPEGYDTMLGERGSLLSGGQKQRICIARAIVRDPAILLLDEATSALDAQSERSVQEALERAAEGRSTIIIAHRLSTIRHADAISVFKDGEIVESGSHDELMSRRRGAYHELISLQQVDGQSEAHSSPEQPFSSSALNLANQVADDSVSKSRANSITDDAPSVSAKEATGRDVDKGVVARAFRMNLGEWFYIIPGMLGAGIAGATWPLNALIFSEVTNLLGDPTKTREISFWACMFVVIGAVSFFGNVMQFGLLGVSGERLTLKMRLLFFRQLLRQEMGYFDERENSVGALTTRLATEASLVKGITGDCLGVATFTAATICVGVGVAFSACWQLALVIVALVPFYAAGGYVQSKRMSGFDAGSKKQFANSGAVASEAVDSIRTITGLGVQDVFINRYGDSLVTPLTNGGRAANVAGLSFGFGEAFSFILWAVAFWVGAKFIQLGYCTFLGLMKAVTGLLFTGISLGNVATMIPNVSAASVAATKIFRLLDRESEIDPMSAEGTRMDQVAGAVLMKDGVFEYPTRPDVSVLRGLDLSAAPGKTIALVGQSGCGKSTVVGLLERFYDLRTGSVLFDGEELRTINLRNARSHMALVQQEPDLFNRTIKENIAYGLSHEEGTPVTDEQITEAARAANAHDFVSGLPLGYDTVVGERGGALSGGQRQRVTIARSLVRQPRLLLLDEATSALDARSERVVQEALDKARQGRTTIVIAHRLSTIKDADAIALVSRGQVAELGTHADLMSKNGLYAELVRNQISKD